jgi:uroporphyrinogen-III decarboxylase
LTGAERIIALVADPGAMARSGIAPLSARRPFMPISMCLAADEVGAKYRDYATDWRVQVRGQLAFAEAFGADHLSVISDPGVEAGDLGAALLAPEDEPAALDEGRALLADKAVLARLAAPGGCPILPGGAPGAAPKLGAARLRPGRRMENRLNAVRGLAEAARGELLVEGWVEGPCAEAADLRGLSRLMMDFYDDPDFVNALLDFVTDYEIAFAEAQIAAGAGLVGVGDAASSLIGPALFEEYMLPRHRRYVAAIHGASALARLHICGNATALLPFAPELGYDLVDLDSMVDMAEARAATGPSQVLTGNLDPVRVVRNGGLAEVNDALEACAAAAGEAWIVGAGCELPRGTPRGNILAMRDFARRGG